MIRWYKCKNQDCKMHNQSFTLVIENMTDKEICPFCHKSELIRDTEREWNNRYALNLSGVK